MCWLAMQINQSTYLQMCSGRNSALAPGSEGCFVMSNTYTSAEGDCKGC